MAQVYADRVKETSTTTGTGTLSLDGAATGFQTFVAGVGTGNTCYYTIALQSGSEWEVGIGTVTDATPDTLSRDTVLASSNAGSLVNFSAGTKDVFVTWPASAAKDASNPIALDVVTTETSIASSTVETNAYSFSVPANTLGTDGLLHLYMEGRYENTSGSTSNLTIKVKYGATTILTPLATAGQSTGKDWKWTLELLLWGDGATNLQEAWAAWRYDLGADQVQGGMGSAADRDGTAAEDSTGALTLAVTVQHSVSNANTIWVTKTAKLLKLAAL